MRVKRGLNVAQLGCKYAWVLFSVVAGGGVVVGNTEIVVVVVVAVVIVR